MKNQQVIILNLQKIAADAALAANKLVNGQYWERELSNDVAAIGKALEEVRRAIRDADDY